MAPGVQQHFGVGMGAKYIAGGLQFCTQFLEVVDLTVEGQPAATICTRHGLLAAREIDDRQASMTKANARFIPPRNGRDAATVLNSGASRADFGTSNFAAVCGVRLK